MIQKVTFQFEKDFGADTESELEDRVSEFIAETELAWGVILNMVNEETIYDR